MGHSTYTRSSDLLAEWPASDNGCTVAFAVSEVRDFTKKKRRAPRVGLLGGRYVRRSTVDRFWARVQKNPNGGCWVFTGAKCCPGGHIYFAREDGSRVSAHRYSYTLHRGSIPSGKVVMHTCDVPACVNPAHLRIGTQRDNVHDAIAKGRMQPWAHPNTVAARHRRKGVRQTLASHASTIAQPYPRQEGDA